MNFLTFSIDLLKFKHYELSPPKTPTNKILFTSVFGIIHFSKRSYNATSDEIVSFSSVDVDKQELEYFVFDCWLWVF